MVSTNEQEREREYDGALFIIPETPEWAVEANKVVNTKGTISANERQRKGDGNDIKSTDETHQNRGNEVRSSE